MGEPFTSTADDDLGLPRRSNVALRSNIGRTNALQVSSDVEDEAHRLMTNTAPANMVQRVLDVIMPSDVRRERRRGEREIIRQEVDARIVVHQAIKTAQIAAIESQADAVAKACKLASVEEVNARALHTETKIEDEIKRSGTEFDRGIDEAVEAGKALKSESAKRSAADRIERLKQMRGQLEIELMDNVANVVRNSKRRR